ncbi:uncharacterized protein LOC128398093 [Panonychus citri]|uniref:uncharacterized protein LOC128398093 n=1 Tax=Panonychus citri TaxID=50023 RepID=UPI002307A966|nr:uncharacterized protein LOC128398093 [Panonychus citri]
MTGCLRTYSIMKQELNRMMSCIDLNERWFDAVKDGFFRFKDADYLQCFCCGLQIAFEFLDEDVVALHASFSPSCSFVLKKEPNLMHRIEGDLHRYSDAVQVQEIDDETSISLPISSLVRSTDGQILQVFSETKILNPEKVFQLYQLRINRHWSFAGSRLTPRQRDWFVESGFFWTGSNRIVQCAFCRLAIDGKLSKLPGEVHNHFSPDCPYANKDSYEAERHLCCVCLFKTTQVLYSPCNHLAVCCSCDSTLKRLGQESCPICRRNVQCRIKVIRP